MSQLLDSSQIRINTVYSVLFEHDATSVSDRIWENAQTWDVRMLQYEQMEV